MWGMILAQDSKVKYHYFINSDSICGKQHLIETDCIQYNPQADQDSKCKECLKEICPQIRA